MRRTFLAFATLLLAHGIHSAHAGDVNIGVSVAGEVAPGVYGRVDIGNARPVLVYQQPMVIVQQPRRVAPVYMHVPPGHAKNWRKHCRKYDACGTPVYFVKSADYRPKHHRGGHHERHEDRGHGRGHDRDDGRGRDHERGHGKGHGHGHGHGHGKH